MRRLRGSSPILFALALIAAPVIALVAIRLATDDEIDAVRADRAPVLTAAQPRTIADERRIAGTPEWQEGRSLRAPTWNGTVTSVDVAPGDTVASGQRLLSVDGVARVAVATPSPFFRQLRAGDSGADVAMLNTVLVALGHLKSVGGDPSFFSFDTHLAVQALAVALDLPGQPSGVFDPAWFVWLPAEPFVLGTVDVVAGEPAPPAGMVFAAEAPRLTKVALASANPQEPLSLDPAVEWVLVVGAGRFPVDAATREVRPEALADLQALLEPKAERVDGVVQRAAPLQVVGVPSTAISVGAAGQLCAWVPDGAGYSAKEVELAGSRGGVTNVRTGLAAGEEVLANPADVLQPAVCP